MNNFAERLSICGLSINVICVSHILLHIKILRLNSRYRSGTRFSNLSSPSSVMLF